MAGRVIAIDEAIDYEVRSSWWASLVGVGWMQDLAAAYFARKARRKWARYSASMPATHARQSSVDAPIGDDPRPARHSNRVGPEQHPAG